MSVINFQITNKMTTVLTIIICEIAQEWGAQRRSQRLFSITVCDLVKCCMFVCGVKPPRKVSCKNTVLAHQCSICHVWWGWVGVWWGGVVCCGVETLCVSVCGWCQVRGQSDGVRFVVSCDHESGVCMCLCLFF